MGHGEGTMVPMGGLGREACFQRCLNGGSEPCPCPGRHLSLLRADGLGVGGLGHAWGPGMLPIWGH